MGSQSPCDELMASLSLGFIDSLFGCVHVVNAVDNLDGISHSAQYFVQHVAT